MLREKSAVYEISNAIVQYMAGKGEVPAVILQNTTLVIGKASGQADLCIFLVPLYIAGLAVDPSVSSSSVYDCNSNYNTGYTVIENPPGHITVSAPNAENGETISVTK